MSPAPAPESTEARYLRFRTKLQVGMMLVVASLTALGLYLAQRKVAVEADLDLQADFHNTLSTLQGLQEVRHAALAERGRALVRRPRIHAALEDDALDLLYLSAQDELRDIMRGDAELEEQQTLRARFYRFLDGNGHVISPPPGAEAGELRTAEEAILSLPQLSSRQQIGYLPRARERAVDEIIAAPIISTDTGEVIAALVLGFQSGDFEAAHSGLALKKGVLWQGELHLPGLSTESLPTLREQLTGALSAWPASDRSLQAELDGSPHRVFYKQLNPGSLYPAAYEIMAYPLAPAQARQQELRTSVLLAGGVLLLVGLLASHFLAARLSAPVEQLEVESAAERIRRARAEAVLEMTSAELQRSARFSADASHQLKTPIAVMRAGLDELQACVDLPPALQEEVSALVHQTFRLTSIVEDLLLLSRMDAGQLQLHSAPVDLMLLVEGLVDDLSTLPDQFDLKIDTHCPGLQILGEQRYVTLILQNLLENARKYNRPGGRIAIACREEGAYGAIIIGNTGPTIPPAAQEHIFERFHRGAIGENVPGHGLGLNLGRELARLHGGDLRLLASADGWTEFEARFLLARTPRMAQSAL